MGEYPNISSQGDLCTVKLVGTPYHISWLNDLNSYHISWLSDSSSCVFQTVWLQDPPSGLRVAVPISR